MLPALSEIKIWTIHRSSFSSLDRKQEQESPPDPLRIPKNTKNRPGVFSKSPPKK
jgi:hypothetical protein